MTRGENDGLRWFGHLLQTSRTIAPRGYLPMLALTLGTGCTLIYGGEVDKKQCKSQTDCDSAATALGTPLVCRQETCQAPTCTQSSECPANSICADHLCVRGTEDAGTNTVACTQDSDCASAEQRCGYDGSCYEKWGCLDEELKWPGAPFNLTYVTRILRAEAPDDPSAVRDIRVEMCAITDTTCMRPVVSSDQVTIGADATVSVPLANGTLSSFFVGVVRFTSTPGDGGTWDQIIPTYRHFVGESPLSGDMVDPITISVFGPQILSSFSLVLGVPLDTAAGMLQVFVADCGGRPAPGVSVSVPDAPSSVFLAMSGGKPVSGAKETTVEGIGTVFNLPAKAQRTAVIRDEGQQRVVTSTLSVLVHGSAIDHVIYYPRNSALQKWLAYAKSRGTASQ